MAVQDNLVLVTKASYKTMEASKLVRWNSVTRTWSPRDPNAEWGVIFLSTNDPTATAPTDPNIKTGDEWVKHPLS
jgi:hypothetical protein